MCGRRSVSRWVDIVVAAVCRDLPVQTWSGFQRKDCNHLVPAVAGCALPAAPRDPKIK